MKLVYYKLKWPDPVVPVRSPLWLFYEVEPRDDIVLRMVECMENGTSQRNSLARENKIGPTCISLVHMPFSEGINGVPFELISGEEFEALYSHAAEMPE